MGLLDVEVSPLGESAEAWEAAYLGKFERDGRLLEPGAILNAITARGEVMVENPIAPKAVKIGSGLTARQVTYAVRGVQMKNDTLNAATEVFFPVGDRMVRIAVIVYSGISANDKVFSKVAVEKKSLPVLESDGKGVYFSYIRPDFGSRVLAVVGGFLPKGPNWMLVGLEGARSPGVVDHWNVFEKKPGQLGMSLGSLALTERPVLEGRTLQHSLLRELEAAKSVDGFTEYGEVTQEGFKAVQGVRLSYTKRTEAGDETVLAAVFRLPDVPKPSPNEFKVEFQINPKCNAAQRKAAEGYFDQLVENFCGTTQIF